MEHLNTFTGNGPDRWRAETSLDKTRSFYTGTDVLRAVRSHYRRILTGDLLVLAERALERGHVHEAERLAREHDRRLAWVFGNGGGA